MSKTNDLGCDVGKRYGMALHVVGYKSADKTFTRATEVKREPPSPAGQRCNPDSLTSSMDAGTLSYGYP